MPNQYGQLTKEDDKAPKGQFRIRKENMTDADVEIIGDFFNFCTACHIISLLRRDDEDNVYLLFNDQGEAID